MIEPWQIALLMDGIAIMILHLAVSFDWISINKKHGAVALFFVFLIMLCLIIPLSACK